VIVAERFAVTTFCRSLADMPTQSREDVRKLVSRKP
jgi:hypothetical protein